MGTFCFRVNLIHVKILWFNIQLYFYRYSWPSGTAGSHIPIPLASFGSTAYLIAKNLKQLKNLRFPTPASIAGAVALDVGIHATRLAYQYSVANETSHDRAEMLAWRLLDLRRKYDYLRVVGHSLGCRHIVEACSLMSPEERQVHNNYTNKTIVLTSIIDQTPFICVLRLWLHQIL